MPGLMTVGGIMPAMGVQELQRREKEKEQEFQAPAPVLTGLAGYVKACWDSAYYARLVTADERLNQCTRQRNGEYDPQTLANIRMFGGSEIFMMLTSNKCRAASAWLRDIYLVDDDKPWDIKPTKLPELPAAAFPQVLARAARDVQLMEGMIGQPLPPTQDNYEMMLDQAKQRLEAEMREDAKERAERMSDKMEDQLQTGRFYDAFNEFLDDLVTYPYAILKGPVVRRRKHLQWTPTAKSGYQLKIVDELRYEWERVQPQMFYWAPDSTHVDDGFVIERHHLTRSDLVSMKGTPGYDDDAIDQVLEDYGVQGFRTWLMTDAMKAESEQKSILGVLSSPEQPIDALQFWGNVQGKMLIEWGLQTSKIEDELADYPCEVWLVNNRVIKAIINPDPLGRKPYFKASFEQVPGGWLGNGVPDLIRDCQDMCNAAARALANNMAIASGPMVWVNLDRLARGENITQLYPWRVFQTTDSQLGNNTAPPVDFFQPNMFVQELLQIYEAFANLADEYSNIPKYMSGNPGGVGRTASGLSMLLNNATKAIKQVAYNIDNNVLKPMIERLYFFNMKYSSDPDLKGDVNIVARGVNNIAVREQLQVQRNQFLSTIANSQVLAQFLTPDAMNSLLRETAKTLGMDTDELVPPKDVVDQKLADLIKQQQVQKAMAQAMQQSGGPMMPGAPVPGGPPPALPIGNPQIGGPHVQPGAALPTPPMPPGQGGPPMAAPPGPAAGPGPAMPPGAPGAPQGIPVGLMAAGMPDLAKIAVAAAARDMLQRGPMMRPNRQVLMDGTPITDAFAPQRQ